MKTFTRADRVGGHIQKILADLLLKDMKDPRLQSAVITGVKMSRDLKSAKVYYAVMGKDTSRDQVAAAIKHAHGWVKRALADRLGLRYMPELRFYYDESIDYGSRIDDLLKLVETGDGSGPSTS